MRLFIIVILLLTASPVIAEGNSTTPSAQLFESNDIASKSATMSAIEPATPSAGGVVQEDLASSGSAIIDEDITQTALIYTGIMTLILFAFIAGKKSSELDKSDN